MRRGGGLHPARPDWWARTKRPWAPLRGLIAVSVTNVSHREVVPPCLRTSPALGETLGDRRTSWCVPFPRHASGIVLVLGYRGAWVSQTPCRVPNQRRPKDTALTPVSGSRFAGSPAWRGLPQYTGYGHWDRTVVLGVRSGLGFAVIPPFAARDGSLRAWVPVFAFVSPVLARPHGFRAWVWVFPSSRPSFLRFAECAFGYGLCRNPTIIGWVWWRVCLGLGFA